MKKILHYKNIFKLVYLSSEHNKKKSTPHCLSLNVFIYLWMMLGTCPFFGGGREYSKLPFCRLRLTLFIPRISVRKLAKRICQRIKKKKKKQKICELLPESDKLKYWKVEINQFPSNTFLISHFWTLCPEICVAVMILQKIWRAMIQNI